MARINYLLFESAIGLSIFEVVYQADPVGLNLKEVQDSINDLRLFGKMVRLVTFVPWQ
jgi:nucleolar protein 56